MNYKNIICLLSCLFLAACVATRINHPPAPLHQQSIVKQFQLGENVSRVHFFIGDLVLNADSRIKMNEAVELYVNNVKIGLLGNSKEYIAIDLYPGTYTFKWMPISSGSDSCSPDPLQLSVIKGEVVFLKANMRDATPTAAMFLGAIGALAMAKQATYFEQDNSLRSNMNELTLVALNEDFKEALSIKKIAPDLTPTQEAAPANVEKKLSDLKQIYEKGLITKEEYEIKRKELIDTL